MIAVFRTMSGEIFVAELHPPPTSFVQKAPAVWEIGEDYTTPMPNPTGSTSPFYGIDRSVFFARTFQRGSLPDTPRHGAALPLQSIAYYEETPDQPMPPEILSRRTQEVEAEWLRLGTLLDKLRKLERG